jgi:2-iminobutanoate/2-iminopropanoate deaminase
MSRQAITAEGAAAVGPYSHGVRAGEFVYCSGQTPLDPATGKLLAGGIPAQTEQCFKNLFNVLQAAGMNDFAAMNEVYGKQFAKPYPARTTIGVASLPLGASIEIELIARAD